MFEATGTMQSRFGRRGLLGVTCAGLLLSLVSACSVVTGSGETGTETRQITGFSKVELVETGEVTIEQGTTDSVSIEADDNVLPVLTSDVVDGTLKLGRKPGTEVITRNPVRYRVTLTKLAGINLSGAGSVTGSNLRAGELEVDISGSGIVNLNGSVDTQRIRLSGSGRYDAADLTSQVAAAELSGTGDVILSVERELTVNISGAGTVSYAGDADVDKSISGVGRLVKR
jgi:hypothetical protein